jgi:hypothetical protein
MELWNRGPRSAPRRYLGFTAMVTEEFGTARQSQAARHATGSPQGGLARTGMSPSLQEKEKMTRRGKFEFKYGSFASTILSSVGRVGAAGRTGDADRITAVRAEHGSLMASVRSTLGLVP